jgi:hypothetical protein
MQLLIIFSCILMYIFIAGLVGVVWYRVGVKRCKYCSGGGRYCNQDHDISAIIIGIFWPFAPALIFLGLGMYRLIMTTANRIVK